MKRQEYALRRLGRTGLTLAALAMALLVFVAIMQLTRLWRRDTPHPTGGGPQ